MALLGTLQVRLGLDTATFGQKFGSFTKDLEKRAKGISKGLSGLTNFGSLLGSASIGASLTQGITVASDFETTINQVAAAADLGNDSIAGLSQQALNISKAFKVFSPRQVAEGMLELTKAGITPAEQEAGALAETMRLAATEGLGLGRAAEVMAEQMGAFGLKAQDTAGIADALAGASIASTASVESLSQGLSQTAKVANLFGLDINETAGSLALFASNGLKGSDAGTSLKTMLSRLIPSTDEAEAAMKQFGITFTTADGKIKDITEVAEILRTKLGGLSAAQRNSTLQTIFGSDAIRAAAILTEQGAAGLEKYIEATKDKNAAERLSEARTRGFSGAMAGLRSAYEAFAISLAKGGFLQGLTDLANKGAGLLDSLSGLPQWAKNLGLGLAVAAVAVPPLALALSNLALAAPAIVTGLGAITAFLVGPWGLALAAGTLAFVAFRGPIEEWAKRNPEDVEKISHAWDGLKGTFGELGAEFAKAFEQYGVTTAAIEQANQQLGQQSKSTWDGVFSAIAGFAADAMHFIAGYISDVIHAIADKTTAILTWADNFWAELQQTGFEGAKAWTEIFTRIPDDLANAWADIKASFQTSIDAIKELWTNYSWSDLGKAIIDGIITGIRNGAEAVAAEARSMADSVAKAAKSILGIRSPSRVFEEIGDNVGQGFVNGILGKVAAAGQAMKRLVTPGQSGSGTAAGLNFGQSFGANFAPRAIDLNQQTGQPLVKSMVAGAGQVQGAWKLAMDESTQAIENFVKTGELDFKSLLDSILAAIATSALKGAIEGLFKGIGSSVSGGTFGTSAGWGDILGSVVKGFTSFEGGGYTGSGSRSGGIDGRGGMLAIVHPNETVIDHEKVRRSSTARRSSGRPVINVSTPINLMPGVSREELSKILPVLKRDILQTIPDLIALGGRRASAFGR